MKGAIPFRGVGIPKNRYYPTIQEACEILIEREERFAKTAVGWILRDISKSDAGFVTAFIDRYVHSFSRESLRNGLKQILEDNSPQ
jgi:3-methyladenine DNA glycosylase AlkD